MTLRRDSFANLSTWAYVTYGLTDMNIFIQKGNRHMLSVIVYVVCVCDVCVGGRGVVCAHGFMQSGGPNLYLPMAPRLAVTGLGVLP